MKKKAVVQIKLILCFEETVVAPLVVVVIVVVLVVIVVLVVDRVTFGVLLDVEGIVVVSVIFFIAVLIHSM